MDYRNNHTMGLHNTYGQNMAAVVTDTHLKKQEKLKENEQLA